MIGWLVAWWWAVACLFGELSQQPTSPQVMHSRRCTHHPPVRRHSEQPSVLEGVTLEVDRVQMRAFGCHASPVVDVPIVSEVGEAVAPAVRRRQRRLPVRVDREERLGIRLEHPDEHARRRSAADRPEPVAVADHVGLAQDVEPERRLAAPAVAREADVGRLEGLGADAGARSPRPTAGRSPGRAGGRARRASGTPRRPRRP